MNTFALPLGALLLGLLLGVWAPRYAGAPAAAPDTPAARQGLGLARHWPALLPALGAPAVVALLPVHSIWLLSQTLLLFSALYVLTVVDLRSLTVDLPVLFGALLLRLLALGLLHPGLLVEMVGGLLAGAGLFALVGLAYQWLRGRSGLGEGDGAVLGLIGAFVGWEGVFAVVFAAALSGLLLGGGWLLLTRRGAGTPLPLVPFLALGGLAVYLAQAQGWNAARLLHLLG